RPPGVCRPQDENHSSSSSPFLVIDWKRKTGFPAFSAPSQFSALNEPVQMKKIFFLYQQKSQLLI
uniref:Uncharacterized protein n=1 Tax=Crocodylus porosus TaxID=8502 RepID=A0A7M4EVF9_CROPO